MVNVLKYVGNAIQLVLVAFVLVSIVAMTPEGRIDYQLSPFLVYMVVSALLTGPYLLPKIWHTVRHWSLSTRPKRHYFHFRETVHQSPFLFDPVKFAGEPQDIGKSDELQNLSAYVVLLIAVSLASPIMWALWVLINAIRHTLAKRV